MLRNQRARLYFGQSDWRKFSIFIGITLVLVICFCLPKYVLAAFDWPPITRGATDETNVRVTMIQYLLRSKGYNAAVDGHYGNQTQHLVRRFQASHGSVADGIVDSRTWSRLIITLKPGSYGNAVRAIQVPLKEVSDTHLSVNGRFDVRTEQAVKKFQRNNNLPVDGIVGNATWLHLTENIYD